MDRNEYIALLSAHLTELPPEEKDSAIDYYDNYFADAGVENEQNIINQLGTPQSLADEITAEVLQTKQLNDEDKPIEPAYTRSKTYQRTIAGLGYAAKYAKTPVKKNVAIILLLILISPFWFLVLTATFAVALAFTVAGVAVAITSVLTIGFGISTISVSAPNGVISLCIGIMALAFAFLFLAAGVQLFGKGLPKVFKLITKVAAPQYAERSVA